MSTVLAIAGDSGLARDNGKSRRFSRLVRGIGEDAGHRREGWRRTDVAAAAAGFAAVRPARASPASLQQLQYA
jgi:hypothetical protein